MSQQCRTLTADTQKLSTLWNEHLGATSKLGGSRGRGHEIGIGSKHAIESSRSPRQWADAEDCRQGSIARILTFVARCTELLVTDMRASTRKAVFASLNPSPVFEAMAVFAEDLANMGDEPYSSVSGRRIKPTLPSW